MKNHLIVYAILIVAFIAYNLFIKIEDERIKSAVYILFTSILFGYIAFLAYSLIKKMGKKK